MKYTGPTLRSVPMICALIALSVCGLLGCGTGSNGMTGGNGVGDAAGPWPQAPTRTAPTAAGRPAADEPPKAPVIVQLISKAAKEHEVRLDVERVEVKYLENWFPMVQRKDIADSETLPLRAGDKGATFLLVRTDIPRRAYTHLRLQLADAKTALVVDEQTTLPLTLKGTTIELKELKLDDKKPNLITITIDGTKITTTAESATLPAEALTVTVSHPAGGVSGKVTPPMPNARVELFWKESKTLLGSGVPALSDGGFTITNLPPGHYRVEVRAPGHHLVEEVKGLVAVEQKIAALKPLALAADTGQQ